jgi:hypothetical protein
MEDCSFSGILMNNKKTTIIYFLRNGFEAFKNV